MLNKSDFVYFIYSKEQQDLQKEIARRKGKALVFGTVIVNGVPKVFTDIHKDPKDSRYTDSRVVTSGYLGDIKYSKGR